MKSPSFNRFRPYYDRSVVSAEVAAYPASWRLVPVEEKSPRVPYWQEGRHSRAEILDFLENGYSLKSKKTGLDYWAYPSGVGILTGDASDGLLLVDFDGPSAMKLWTAMGGDETIASMTRSHSSGKEGRFQVWLQIPESYRSLMSSFTRRVVKEWNGVKSVSGELLELRYNRCQSVLPPSLHPETGQYQWVNEGEVIVCPDRLLEILVSWAIGEKEDIAVKERSNLERERLRELRLEEWRNCGGGSSSKGILDFLEFEVLPRLSPEQIYEDISRV